MPTRKSLCARKILELNDFQKILGDIIWICLSLGIPNSETTNLFLTLDVKSTLDSVNQLTPKAQKELEFMDWLQKFYLSRFTPGEKVWLLLFATPQSPNAEIA